MSIATKPLQQSFHEPNRRTTQQQESRTFIHNQQECNRKKSIDSTIKIQEEHVTKNVLKSKQLLRQTPVAVTEAEEKPEDKKAKSQSQEINNEIFKGIDEDNYSNVQENGNVTDYKIYQNGQVNEFFKNEILEKPQKISDICLVNDHYILVKMPNRETPLTNNNSAEAAVRRQEFKALKEHNDRILKETEKDHRQLCRYLRNKRNRITRIAPIHEEPEDLSDSENKTQSKLYCLKMQSCWQVTEQDQVEIYQTQTKIHKSFTNSPNKSGTKIIKQLSPLKPATEQSKCNNIKNPLDIQTISGDLLKSSPHHQQVYLHNYGSLMESTNYKNNVETINSPRRRKCPRFESLYWLLRPFRGKYRKTKPKIQAVVYKTYFVKWTKPPVTLSHGYGVKSSKSAEMEVSVLRRCRSAIF